MLEQLLPEKPSGVSAYNELITFVTDRPGYGFRYVIDASKIEKELGWRPVETFESGMAKTVAWYLKNTAWWQATLSGEYQLQRSGTNPR